MPDIYVMAFFFFFFFFKLSSIAAFTLVNDFSASSNNASCIHLKKTIVTNYKLHYCL